MWRRIRGYPYPRDYARGQTQRSGVHVHMCMRHALWHVLHIWHMLRACYMWCACYMPVALWQCTDMVQGGHVLHRNGARAYPLGIAVYMCAISHAH